jgi:hypothetical protein
MTIRRTFLLSKLCRRGSSLLALGLVGITCRQAHGEWMRHRIDSAAAVRYSALFPAFEADAMTQMIEREPVGADNVADLILLNYKPRISWATSTVPIRVSSASLSARWTVS